MVELKPLKRVIETAQGAGLTRQEEPPSFAKPAAAGGGTGSCLKC
jgi:hypothetical protein